MCQHVIWAVHRVLLMFFFCQAQMTYGWFLEKIHWKTMEHLSLIILDIYLFFSLWWKCPVEEEDQVWLVLSYAETLRHQIIAYFFKVGLIFCFYHKLNIKNHKSCSFTSSACQRNAIIYYSPWHTYTCIKNDIYFASTLMTWCLIFPTYL